MIGICEQHWDFPLAENLAKKTIVREETKDTHLGRPEMHLYVLINITGRLSLGMVLLTLVM